MNHSAKDKAKQLLESELARVQKERLRVAEKVRELDAEERTLKLSINALTRRAAASKAAPKKKDVIGAIEQILAEQGPLAEAALKSLVWDHIAAKGQSHSGLALRFDESLSSPRFVCASGTVSLAGKAALPVTRPLPKGQVQ